MMIFKSELAQKFYNEMIGALDVAFRKLGQVQDQKQGELEVSEQISVAFAVINRNIEMKQSVCKDAAEIEIQDLASKEGVKLGMASIMASNMGEKE